MIHRQLQEENDSYTLTDFSNDIDVDDFARYFKLVLRYRSVRRFGIRANCGSDNLFLIALAQVIGETLALIARSHTLARNQDTSSRVIRKYIVYFADDFLCHDWGSSLGCKIICFVVRRFLPKIGGCQNDSNEFAE